MTARPILSAILPTRDRHGLIDGAVDTLQSQDIDEGMLEILVVDDGSEPALEPLLAERPGRHHLKVIRQAPSGLTVARNTGAAHASGPILAYLDDDTLVSPGWARAVVEAFDGGRCDAVAGRVELRFDVSPPPWLVRPALRRYLAELELGGKALDLPSPWLPVGANCAVTREWYDKLGGFRPGFDRMGTSLLSNGDREFFERLRLMGGRIRYEPRAHLLHRVPAERTTVEFFKRRTHAQGVSDILLRAPRAGRGLSLARESIRAARAVPILAKSVAQGDAFVNASLWLSYCQGRRDAIRAGAIAPTP